MPAYRLVKLANGSHSLHSLAHGETFHPVIGPVAEAEALSERGLIRNRSVAPPPASDGTVRVVEIVGLDRQACGGTHLSSTGASRPVRILKIDNKGRHNRRIKIALACGSE